MIGRRFRVSGSFSILAVLTGCARGPNVSSDLPLRRVVVYRNGVGYFERSGKVDTDHVKFKMRGRMVGDFLATLAIVERGGGTVRSASFPLDVKDDNEQQPAPPTQPTPPCPIEPLKTAPSTEDPSPNRLRDVVLSLDGDEHDLSIGYVAETPVWRPSYRVVVQTGNLADLQTWGIVQNLSGEEWSNVDLVLVAGAPIAFQSTLGTPVIPDRPIVTDTGEVIAAVPGGETTLAEPPAPAPAAPPPPPEAEASVAADNEPAASDKDEEKPRAKKAATRGVGAGGGAHAYGAAAPASAPMPLMLRSESLSAPRSVSALAAVALEAGTTRYAIPYKVNVPDKSATMVLLLHESVPGSAVFLFAPDPGVPDSSAHPFRVVRFTNATPGLLERGPIAVFEKGSFLGEGVLEPLPPKATATVPFALERGLAVDSEQRFDELGARVVKIEASQLYIERDQVHKTTYKVKNGGADAAHLLIKHPRTPGSHLFQPPPGTEDNVGTGTALIPVDVGSYGTAELVVDERSPFQQPSDWLSDIANVAVRAYLADPKSDAKVGASLTSAFSIRDKLRALYDERDKLTAEQAELERSTRESRASLKALEKNKKAADLVAKLTERLRQDGDRLDAITKRLIEVGLASNEQEVRFRDAIRDITLVTPPAPKD
ncbi:MAG TPA: hypothetical protein VH142_13025 [Polyangiaceae bacterium]|nr:hypothetical protein [Polyangiaceae bacterium]